MIIGVPKEVKKRRTSNRPRAIQCARASRIRSQSIGRK